MTAAADESLYHTLTISDIKTEATGVKTIFLSKSDSFSLPYKAGQFLTFIFPGNYDGEQRRSYSFSSSPDTDNFISITVKRVPNGRYSRYFADNARIGDTLKTIGAGGLFILPEHQTFKQYFFLAAGVGITPVFSMIKSLLQRSDDSEVILFYSNTSVSETIFYNELEALKTAHTRRFHIIYLFSTAADLSRARLSKWLLPQLLEEYASGDKSSHIFYLCGPFAYMRMAALGLEEAGYAREQVRKEEFDTTRPKPKILPPDQEQHKVTILFKDKTYNLQVQYPATILQTAKKQGIPLPYSCETGQCGTCTAKCTNGHVWMATNEVLTDADLAKGLILTCTGYPVGGDAEIRYKI
ncbi:2Fe-2S iron-sulfur cluster-binding protein [Chitinophagaceae bacterium MMS25-I14]